MEWVVVLVVAFAMPVWAAIYLVRKLLRLKPQYLKLQELSKSLSEASAKVPEIKLLVSNLEDDPVLHVAKRMELQKAKRKLKSQRERRLRSRVL